MDTPAGINVDPATLFGIVTAALAIAGSAIRLVEIVASRLLFGDRKSDTESSDFRVAVKDMRTMVEGMVRDVDAKLSTITSELHERIDDHISDTNRRLGDIERDVAVLKDRSKRKAV